MAKLNLDYYNPKSDSVYSDGDIENELLAIVRQSKEEPYDWLKDGRWPIVYHLSHLRHNILNWYPFSPGATILEIGAGCGALTGLLCERAAKVVAVELTKRRAEINMERHSQFDNLEIVVSDFQSIPRDWSFDYVIVNGVLEYAAYMLTSERPYEAFLSLSASHLNPGGKMVIAIENRLGLKYLSGAKEDHTGTYFSGINGYTDGEKVRTFTKKELIDVIEHAGLHALKFYYPYPDYKFPAEIFTDRTISRMLPSVPDIPLDMARAKMFDEQAMYTSLMDLEVLDRFANSFLVEVAANSRLEAADISYIKISANRNRAYRICTYFDEDMKYAYKKELSPQGNGHLCEMSRFSGFTYNDARIKNITCMETEEGLRFPFISGETLESALLSAYAVNDVQSFDNILENFRDQLYTGVPLQELEPSDKFRECFGAVVAVRPLRWASEANVDMISGNIFYQDGEYRVIDYEWHMPCEVPLEYVFWRLLKQLRDDRLQGNFPSRDKFLELIQIDSQTERTFVAWEAHFANEYVGMRGLFQLSKDIVPIDLEQVIERQLKENMLQSTLFYDLGEGFSESNVESCQAVYNDSGFTVTFTSEMLKSAQRLRFDPLEGHASIIEIQRIETNGTSIAYTAMNAEQYIDGQGYHFFTFDPQFSITGDMSEAAYLRIYFSCKIIGWTEGYHKKEQELQACRQAYEELKVQNQKQQETYEQAVRELAVKQQQMYDALTEELANKQEELERLKHHLGHVERLMKDNRIKSTVKILLYGSVIRRESGGQG